MHAEVARGGAACRFEREYFRADGSRMPAQVATMHIADAQQLVLVWDLSARKRAERTLRFLSEATRLLGERLDRPEALLEGLAKWVAERMATCCVIELFTGDGALKRVAAEHRDPEKRALLQSATAFGPRDLASTPLLRPLQQGRSVLVENLDEEARSQFASCPEQQRLMERLAPRSIIFAAMSIHGRTHGVISLSSGDRRFDRDDLSVAEELGRRAAVAIENALLFQDAQRAIRLRDEFLTVASHELKTPLTPLALRLQQLQRLAASELPVEALRTEVNEVAGAAMEQVRKVAALVRDLLDVSRISEGRPRTIRQSVDLEAVVREVCRGLSGDAEQAGCEIDLRANGPVVGMWDRLRLEEVTANLMLNAFKYGAGRPVHVRVEVSGDRAQLRVRDEGIGIAPEHLERIFGKFERAVSGRHYGGLGLGLFVARQLVEAMGGEILVDSIPSQGAIFTVELPLCASETAEPSGGRAVG